MGAPRKKTGGRPGGLYVILAGTWRKILRDVAATAEGRRFKSLDAESQEKFYHDLARVGVWPQNRTPYFPGHGMVSRQFYEGHLERYRRLDDLFPELTRRGRVAFRARIHELNTAQAGDPKSRGFWPAVHGYFSDDEGNVVRDLDGLSAAAVKGLFLLRTERGP